jgi:polyisoprenyl-phosphate glycosyltransferase
LSTIASRLPLRVRLVIPVYRDWESAGILCRMLDGVFRAHPGYAAGVVFVDDGSNVAPEIVRLGEFTSLEWVRVLFLRRNLGHQQAIALGLSYLREKEPCDFVVVMDSDGEDRPEDVPALLAQLESSADCSAVFAERGKRLEGFRFQTGYLLYRLVHYLLTGRSIRIGNFSALRASALERLTLMPELWNHYAASVVVSGLQYLQIRLNRGKRLRGKSQMRLGALVLHGFSAMSVYPTLNVRVLMGVLCASIAVIALAAAVVGIRLWTDLAIPGWTTMVLGLAAVLLVTLVFTSFLFVFVNIAFRNIASALPARDWPAFIERCETFHPNAVHR